MKAMEDRRKNTPPSEAPLFQEIRYDRPLDKLGNTLPLQRFIEHHLGRVEASDFYDPDELGVLAVNPFIP